MKEIDGWFIKKWINQAVDLLKREKGYINDINVYPVADGDTGTNMLLTLLGAMQKVNGARSANLVLEELKLGALESAKGNSGIILSQFFWGFSEAIGNKEKLTAKDLAEGFKKGYVAAFNAIINPVEGTILTVMREVAEEAEKISEDIPSFVSRLYERAVKALQKTPELLAKLGKPRVIDSGAYGFVLILEALARVLKPMEKKGFRIRGIKVKREKSVEFCSNFYAEINPIAKEELKKKLSKLGNSIIFMDAGEKVKIHIHTKNPEKVAKEIEKFGKILSQHIEKIG